MVALEGQHTGWLAKAFSRERPSSINRERISSIFWAEAWSRSSARMKMMLGRSVADSASCFWDVPDDEQPATKRRKTDRHARAPKGALLIALKGLSALLIVTQLPFFLAGSFSIPNILIPEP